MNDVDGADAQRGPRGDGAGDPKHKYMHVLQQIANRQKEHLTVDLDDLAEYESHLPEDLARGLKLVYSIEQNAKHYIDILSRAVDKCLPTPSQEVSFKGDVLDVIIQHRKTETDATLRVLQEGNEPALETIFPPELLRRYGLSFKPVSPNGSSDERDNKPMAIRNVKGEHLGHLITLRGIVTRATEVKPAILVSGYVCDTCGSEVFQPVTSRSYTPLLECSSSDCKENNTKGQLVAVPLSLIHI